MPASAAIPVTIVVPTIGRPSLLRLLDALATGSGPAPEGVVVVDDRSTPSGPLDVRRLPWPTRVIASGGRGPAAARNAGWRVSLSDWIAFLDDDVVPPVDWAARLAEDLADIGIDTVASQGRVVVPRPERPVNDDAWRDALGLTGARWATADIAYRRAALARVGGFDERFPRAYREDTDLGLRASRHGQIVLGRRTVAHPARPGPWWSSITSQAGNADDALMRALHGPGWRTAGSAPAGALRRHVLVTTAGIVSAGLVASGLRRAALAPGAVAAAGTASFAWSRRRAPDGRPARLGPWLATSVAIPPAATAWAAIGVVRATRVRHRRPGHGPTRAVIFDRDGTLIHDVPYNGDPARVRPVEHAAEALRRLRELGVGVAMVTNQSGIARGLVTRAEAEAVNEEVARQLGPFDATLLCPHAPDDRCGCRKPAPRMIEAALAELRVAPEQAVVIGDIGSDVAAARAAGARAVLVPTSVTRRAEVEAAPAVARHLGEAVDMVLSGAA